MTGTHLPGVDDIGADEVIAVLAEVCPMTSIGAIHAGPRSYANRLWRVETDEGDLLVRVPGRTVDPNVLRGALVASRLAHEHGIPTSRFRAFAPTTRLGRPIVVQEFGPGELVSDSGLDLRDVGSTLGEWVARLHSIRRARFGPVLRTTDDRSWGTIVTAQVTSMLSELKDEVLPAPRDTIRAAFAPYESVVGERTSTLTHGDLYLDNLLAHEGRLSCLLDFEHASFRDRFFDFGKLQELVFDNHPETEEPFWKAYRRMHPPRADDRQRMAISQGLYALTYLHYFNSWQPDLIDFYQNRLHHWLISEGML
jgi:aminoglycoside phosphotransferase (APT) family kinase protein